MTTGDKAATADRRTIRLKDLLGPGKEIHIEHDGDRYTLRLTSKGKLLLTK